MGVRHTETSLIVWSQGAEVMTAAPTVKTHALATPLFDADLFYNAGDKGCAFGPMDEIAALMRKMASGQTLEIHATDPSVAFDLTAWCRMTGNALVEQRDGHYLVRKS
ncbi:MAG: sulfurtransferase TusA family protein [Caldilinea sp.]